MDLLTSTGIAGVVGIVVSFSLETFPAVKTAWDGVNDNYKRSVLLALFLVAPFAILGLSCTGAQFISSPCPSGAFANLPFYYQNIWLGLVAFASSQWGFANGAHSLDAKG